MTVVTGKSAVSGWTAPISAEDQFQAFADFTAMSISGPEGEDGGGDMSRGSGAQYSVAFETELPNNLYPGGTYRSHFQAANTSLNNTIASDEVFVNSMSELGITIPKSRTGNIIGKSPNGWVWHHSTEPGIMQLVPKVQHTFGSPYWYTMHPGGVGGMSIWNNK